MTLAPQSKSVTDTRTISYMFCYSTASVTHPRRLLPETATAAKLRTATALQFAARWGRRLIRGDLLLLPSCAPTLPQPPNPASQPNQFLICQLWTRDNIYFSEFQVFFRILHILPHGIMSILTTFSNEIKWEPFFFLVSLVFCKIFWVFLSEFCPKKGELPGSYS